MGVNYVVGETTQPGYGDPPLALSGIIPGTLYVGFHIRRIRPSIERDAGCWAREHSAAARGGLLGRKALVVISRTLVVDLLHGWSSHQVDFTYLQPTRGGGACLTRGSERTAGCWPYPLTYLYTYIRTYGYTRAGIPYKLGGMASVVRVNVGRIQQGMSIKHLVFHAKSTLVNVDFTAALKIW